MFFFYIGVGFIHKFDAFVYRVLFGGYLYKRMLLYFFLFHFVLWMHRILSVGRSDVILRFAIVW